MELLDELLNILDNKSAGNNTPFKNEQEKEIYESNLMFIYRRGETARYHLSNVQKFIASEKNFKLPEFDDLKSDKSFPNIGASASISRSASDVSHEFIAFLSAIRSGLDFMSKFMIRHIKGIQGDSLKTLLKLKDNKSNALVSLIKKNEDWLFFLRGYRDALIHNFNPVYHLANTNTLKCGQTHKVFYPVLASKDIPKFKLDTRKSRNFINVEDKFVIAEWKIESSTAINKEVKSGIEVKPAKGYIEIEKLMEEQYDNYLRLFSKLLTVLKEIDLKIIELKSV